MTTSDSASLAAHLAFHGLDADMLAQLPNVWRDIEGALPSLLDGFYRHLKAVPHLAAMIGDQQPRLVGAQTKHWQRLFSGRFDDSYEASARRISLTHHRIGLEPGWYIGGYSYVLRELGGVLLRAHRLRPGIAALRLRAATAVCLLDMDIAISVYQEVLLADRQRRGDSLAAAIEAFSTAVADRLRQSATAGEALQQCAGELDAATTRSLREVELVNEAARQTADNVQAGAVATEELSASVREIGHQSMQSAEVARQASDDAGVVTLAMKSLADRANQIGDVVELINTIAAQTNLLALNATIEAARAGNAGRGFAVVASEVKALAGQTARATTEIASQIGQMQQATRETVDRVSVIARTIEQINGNAVSIASAVEQQTAATSEIARSMQDSSGNMQRVSGGIDQLRMVTEQVCTTGVALTRARESLAEQLAGLSDEIDRFLAGATAA
jgi:hypothetical protein